ncbi:hypothetical protein L218DRAFT_947007 [Marasmius fiardii PR-910]|nr:hypothetical protein L218DRAFT_947007 [Marasmius fiardii PR-910]
MISFADLQWCRRCGNPEQFILDDDQNETLLRKMPVYPTETSVSAAFQEISASNNSGNNVLTTILVIVAMLLATGGGVMKWLYPNTIEDVEAQIKVVDELIEGNMALGRNILGNSAWAFKDRLTRENDMACRIKNTRDAEPDRRDLLAWVVFRWCQMQDVKASYLAVMELKNNLANRSAAPNTDQDGLSAEMTEVVTPIPFLGSQEHEIKSWFDHSDSEMKENLDEEKGNEEGLGRSSGEVTRGSRLFSREQTDGH